MLRRWVVAKPRIFLSSTFYDLKQVRADLERFIREHLGYEPVLNEEGHIPYGAQDKLEEYCYKEVGLCDIFVAIVGGRFGSSSQHDPYSVTQMEIKTALKQGRQVYVFIEKSVYSEYQTYLVNKSATSIQYRFVDDVRIYKFIEEILQLPNNNPVHPFETPENIPYFLKEQWAGLFQRILK